MKSPHTYRPNNSLYGFTLIEILVVLAITAILLSFGLLISLDAYRQYAFDAEKNTLVSIVQKARSRALSNRYQSPYGVCYLAPDYILFQGAGCIAGASTNEVIPANTNIANLSHFSATFPTVVFSPLRATTTPVTITLTDGVRSVTIRTNYEGVIDW